jgi:uncharacterized RDD family membrane protein YckC
MEENNIQPEETGLADELNQFTQYIQASQGQRFLNWLIDNLLMRFGLSYLSGTIVGFLMAKMFPEYMMRIVYSNDRSDLIVISVIIVVFNYLFYYTFCEKVFKGYTLGKLITGTRAIRDDGHELTFKDAFLRTLSRIVPFEAFSGFGLKPWHDSWTNTSVVKAR